MPHSLEDSAHGSWPEVGGPGCSTRGSQGKWRSRKVPERKGLCLEITPRVKPLGPPTKTEKCASLLPDGALKPVRLADQYNYHMHIVFDFILRKSIIVCVREDLNCTAGEEPHF